MYLRGYSNLPAKRYYWDCGSDMMNQMASDCMRRDRFIKIMRFFHFTENTKLDKLCKLRHPVEKLNENVLKYFVPRKNFNFDEAMIKYYGRHTCKQYIRGKRRFWVFDFINIPRRFYQ